MNSIRYLAVVLLLCCCRQAFCIDSSSNTDFKIPAAQAKGEEYNQVRDKLMTTMFFRGELADKIIEAGLQNKLLALSGHEAYSEVRASLLGWIEKHYEEAANLYFYLQIKPEDRPVIPEVMEYKVKVWEINPGFLELVENVNKVSGDFSVSREEMSRVAQRLFEGPQVSPEAAAPWISGLDAALPGGGYSGRAAIKYADYNLNPSALGQERAKLNAWYEKAKAGVQSAPVGRQGTEFFALKERVIAESFAAYGKFTAISADIGGRNKINKNEAEKLEASRLELRVGVGRMEVVALIARLQARADMLDPGVPGAQQLVNEAKALVNTLMQKIAAMSAENIKTGRLLELSELIKAADYWTLRFSVFLRVDYLQKTIRKHGFSCVADKLFFSVISILAPKAAYVRSDKELQAISEVLTGSLELASAGGGGTGSVGRLAETLASAERELALLNSYSVFNRYVQFFLWDIVLNPSGLDIGPVLRGPALMQFLQ